MISINKKAPEFTLPNQNGEKIGLKNLLGNWVLIYFYPKDDTPGCTQEACGFQSGLPKFKTHGLKILGISADSIESHKKFADKFKLKFDLLSDEAKTVIQKYGAWQEKSMYGKKFMGIVRMSVLINPEGKIVKIYPKVKPENHAEEVMQDLKTLRSQIKKS